AFFHGICCHPCCHTGHSARAVFVSWQICGECQFALQSVKRGETNMYERAVCGAGCLRVCVWCGVLKCVYICMYVWCELECVCICVHVCICVCACVHESESECVCVCVCMCVCAG